MHTQLWHFLQGRQRQHRFRNQRPEKMFSQKSRANKAQVLVIFAFGIFALISFLGLAMDAASLYLTHARLKRAVDAAAVSAANDIKQGQQVEQLTQAAKEILLLHDVVMEEDGVDLVDLQVYDCNVADPSTLPTDFAEICPTGNESPRKLVYVQATQAAPLYFMQLIGFTEIPLTVSSISEAAPVDLVIVIDTSESMGSDATDFVHGGVYNAKTCNDANNCQPLQEAKEAAIKLMGSLYEGYDKIAVVTYDTQAHPNWIYGMDGKEHNLSDNFTRMDPDPPDGLPRYNDVQRVIEGIKLHDDPSQYWIFPKWINRGGTAEDHDIPVFNPIFPDDRDGDGLDKDKPRNCVGSETYNNTGGTCCTVNNELWDDSPSPDPYKWGGIPCDDDTKWDALDFDADGIYTENDTLKANQWLADHGSFSFVSTCTGCGIRTASNILKKEGRPNSVWVIVLLSDGAVNMTDTPATANELGSPEVIPTEYAVGYCIDQLDEDHADDPTWLYLCQDDDLSTRYCIDDNQDECPPGAIYRPANVKENYYTAYDWTLDMIDAAALTVVSAGSDEPIGNEIALYAIGLGKGVTKENDRSHEVAGATLLRYMAAVGDDGNRLTDPCLDNDGNPRPVDESCGQYYYAPEGGALDAIFEDIAGRIYTRITQ